MTSLHRRARLIHPVIAIAGILLLLLAGACTVRDEMILTPSGSGEALVSVDVHPVLMAYFTDLVIAMTGAEGEPPMFNLEALSASFQERPGVHLIAAEEISRGSLRLHVAFDDISALFAQNDAADVATFSEVGNRRDLRVVLNREAVNRFLSYAPEESRMLADLLLPPPDGSISAEEYRGELSWALEEYGDPSDVTGALDGAQIEVVVRPQGHILSQHGGEIVGNAVVFRIPVLQLLTLEEELVYSLSFAP